MDGSRLYLLGCKVVWAMCPSCDTELFTNNVTVPGKRDQLGNFFKIELLL